MPSIRILHSTPTRPLMLNKNMNQQAKVGTWNRTPASCATNPTKEIGCRWMLSSAEINSMVLMRKMLLGEFIPLTVLRWGLHFPGRGSAKIVRHSARVPISLSTKSWKHYRSITAQRQHRRIEKARRPQTARNRRPMIGLLPRMRRCFSRMADTQSTTQLMANKAPNSHSWAVNAIPCPPIDHTGMGQRPRTGEIAIKSKINSAKMFKALMLPINSSMLKLDRAEENI